MCLFLFLSLTLLAATAVHSRPVGARGIIPPPQILADPLNLSQPGGPDYDHHITTYLLPQIFRPSYGPVPTEEERLKIEPYKLNYRYIHFSCYRYYCASTSSESKFLRLFTLWSHLFQVRKGRGDMKN